MGEKKSRGGRGKQRASGILLIRKQKTTETIIFAVTSGLLEVKKQK